MLIKGLVVGRRFESDAPVAQADCTIDLKDGAIMVMGGSDMLKVMVDEVGEEAVFAKVGDRLFKMDFNRDEPRHKVEGFVALEQHWQFLTYVDQTYHNVAVSRGIEAAQEELDSWIGTIAAMLVLMEVKPDGGIKYRYQVSYGRSGQIPNELHYTNGVTQHVVAKVFGDGRIERRDFAEHFTDPVDLKEKDVPGDIRAFAERFCLLGNIDGLCDPMYVSNLVAKELGRGDGQGVFDPDAATVITQAQAEAISQKLCSIYTPSLTEANRTIMSAIQPLVTGLLLKNIGVSRDPVEVFVYQDGMADRDAKRTAMHA